jgi:transcription initiation factor TFIID TATA-box-binding protein
MSFPAESGPPPQIESVIASGSIENSIDTDRLLSEHPNTFETTYGFCGVIYRPPEAVSSATICLFKNGNINIVGANSKPDANSGVERLLEILSSTGKSVSSETPITFENVVCTADLDTHVNLYELAVDLGLEKTEYEPEQFTGLVYRPGQPSSNVTFLIFHNGSLVVTGCKSHVEAKESYSDLLDELRGYHISEHQPAENKAN